MTARERYNSLFEFYAGRYGLDWRALKAQGIAESNLKADAVSPVGAAGVMQFMLPTWIEWHNKIYPGGVVEQRTNPERSIELGAAYMGWLASRLGGDQRLARAAYNWGIGNVLRHSERTQFRFVLPAAKLPPETQGYLARIDRIYETLFTGGTS